MFKLENGTFAAYLISFLAITLIGCGSEESSRGQSYSASIDLQSGPPGSLITLTSSNMDLSNLEAVTINGATQLIVSKSQNSASIFLMPNTTSGTLTVSISGGTTANLGSFTVTSSALPSTQQGSKLVGSDLVGTSISQGFSTALSADGNTLLVGGRGTPM